MSKDIFKELNTIKKTLYDFTARVDANGVTMHEQSTADITDVQEAITDVMLNQINDELINE